MIFQRYKDFTDYAHHIKLEGILFEDYKTIIFTTSPIKHERHGKVRVYEYLEFHKVDMSEIVNHIKIEYDTKICRLWDTDMEDYIEFDDKHVIFNSFKKEVTYLCQRSINAIE